MSSLIGRLSMAFAYLCVATVLATGATALYLRANGVLTDDKLRQMAMAFQGNAPLETERAQPKETKQQEDEQPSYEDREQARDLRARNLELREQALNSRLDLVRSEQRALMVDKDRHERLKTAFKDQLASLRDVTLSSGRENVRLIWENIKPKQAKEQMLQMLAANEINEVVAILSAMPIERRAKIVSEFKTADEAAKLDEMLRLIREGVPEATLIDKTLNQVEQ